jgi:hypothetical protein
MKIIALYDNTMRSSDGSKKDYNVCLAFKGLTQKPEHSTPEVFILQIIISSLGLPLVEHPRSPGDFTD